MSTITRILPVMALFIAFLQSGCGCYIDGYNVVCQMNDDSAPDGWMADMGNIGNVNNPEPVDMTPECPDGSSCLESVTLPTFTNMNSFKVKCNFVNDESGKKVIRCENETINPLASHNYLSINLPGSKVDISFAYECTYEYMPNSGIVQSDFWHASRLDCTGATGEVVPMAYIDYGPGKMKIEQKDYNFPNSTHFLCLKSNARRPCTVKNLILTPR